MRAFYIYLNAVGIYALITLPALMLPIIYVVSMGYVLLYGWFAFCLFALIYWVVNTNCLNNQLRMSLLGSGVVLSVLFAFQMIGLLGSEKDIWNDGFFLLFPLAAIVSGWISLFRHRKHIITKEEKFEFEETGVTGAGPLQSS